MSDDEHWVGQIVEYVTEQIRAERDAAIARAEAAEAQVANLKEALRSCLNYVENTESEFGMKLSCGDLARAALEPSDG